jgi:hypothetical protein
MSDIVERLNGASPSIMAMRDGAREIERLRNDLQRAIRQRDMWETAHGEKCTQLAAAQADARFWRSEVERIAKKQNVVF